MKTEHHNHRSMTNLCPVVEVGSEQLSKAIDRYEAFILCSNCDEWGITESANFCLHCGFEVEVMKEPKPERKKLFPKQCSCGSAPLCDTQPVAPTMRFIVRCPKCRQSRVATSIENAIELWNDTTPDYIEPVKEECGNCRFWKEFNKPVLSGTARTLCRKSPYFTERMTDDWCGEWKPK